MEQDKRKLARDRKRKNRYFLKELEVDMKRLKHEKENSQKSSDGK